MAKDDGSGEMGKPINGLTKLVTSIGGLASAGADYITGISHKKIRSEVSYKANHKAIAGENEEHQNNGEEVTVLDSASTIQNWLMRVRPYVSSAMAETIQGQLYVLTFVQAPTMTGMVVDNLLSCLDKSLKRASDEREKIFIRETFCSMIQNLMFICDARMSYVIEKNREDAATLLVQAGELLDSTISAIASSVATPGSSVPRVANIFAPQTAKNGFYKKLASWLGQKKDLETKRAEYYSSITNLFKTLDRYSSMIGPSILICGMLERYRPIVLSYYRKQWEKEVKIKGGVSIDAVSSLIVASGQLLDSIWNPKKMGENVKKAGKTISRIRPVDPYSMSEIQTAEKRLIADLAVAKKEEEDIRDEQQSTDEQLELTKAYQLALKKRLREKLKELDINHAAAVKQRQEIENKLLQVQELIKQEQPMLKQLQQMDDDFLRVIEKYAE